MSIYDDEKYLKLMLEIERLKEKLQKDDKFERVQKGDIIYIKPSPLSTSSEKQFTRPYLVVSNNMGNANSGIVLGVPLTTHDNKPAIPTHIPLSYHQSTALCEQIKTIDKADIVTINYHLKNSEIEAVNDRLRISLDL